MAIDAAFLARVRIELLDQKHDRAAFSCGDPQLDNYIQKTARNQQEADIARVYVACLDDQNVVIAYYAINAHSIDTSTLPADVRKKLPSYPTIPAIYLSKLAVHQNGHQGKGLGTRLLSHVFKRCVDSADIAGAHFIVLDALNERAAKLYRELGFVDLPGHEPRMFIKIAMVRKALSKAQDDAKAKTQAK
jgi:ribosomal protein S18 acetylase RimI-like enzyme